MTISIDSNVIAALWNKDHSMNAVAVEVLSKLSAPERLLVAGPVYSELMAGPLRTEESLDMFLDDTGIAVDWAMQEEIWREAGRAYLRYVRRRKASRGGDARRILADFIIGAHALVRCHKLLTLDSADLAIAFPTLPIITP
jgi:predicted nucleic acid-binding protein